MHGGVNGSSELSDFGCKGDPLLVLSFDVILDFVVGWEWGRGVIDVGGLGEAFDVDVLCLFFIQLSVVEVADFEGGTKFHETVVKLEGLGLVW